MSTSAEPHPPLVYHSPERLGIFTHLLAAGDQVSERIYRKPTFHERCNDISPSFVTRQARVVDVRKEYLSEYDPREICTLDNGSVYRRYYPHGCIGHWRSQPSDSQYEQDCLAPMEGHTPDELYLGRLYPADHDHAQDVWRVALSQSIDALSQRVVTGELSVADATELERLLPLPGIEAPDPESATPG